MPHGAAISALLQVAPSNHNTISLGGNEGAACGIHFGDASTRRSATKSTSQVSHPSKIQIYSFLRLSLVARRSSFTKFCCPPTLFVLPFPCALKAHNPERASTEGTGVGARRIFFWFCGSDPVPDSGTNSVTNYVPTSHLVFSALSCPAPRYPRWIHATFGAKVHANFGNPFSQWFSGCSTLVCVADFGCQSFCADERRLAS